MRIFFILISFILFKWWRFFCGQTFLVVLQRHNFLCGKKNLPQWYFEHAYILKPCREEWQVWAKAFLPCFKSSINITPIYSLTTHTVTLHFELSCAFPSTKETFLYNVEKTHRLLFPKSSILRTIAYQISQKIRECWIFSCTGWGRFIIGLSKSVLWLKLMAVQLFQSLKETVLLPFLSEQLHSCSLLYPTTYRNLRERNPWLTVSGVKGEKGSCKWLRKTEKCSLCIMRNFITYKVHSLSLKFE